MTSHAGIEEVAAEWLMRRHEPDWSIDDQRALDHWLDAAMAHKAAYWRLEEGYAQLDRLAALGLVNESRNPIPLTIPRRWRLRAGVMTGLAGMAMAGAFYAMPARRVSPSADLAVHATRIGEIGQLKLNDGSQVELNTDSRIRVTQAQGGREMWLDKGEVFLDVVHDPKRPFLVHGGPADITVLGTRFAVRRQGEKVIISVVEGRVQVAPAKRPGGSAVTVTRGEIAATNGTSTLVTGDAMHDVERGLAWQQRKLIFENTPLPQAAAEFNRYNLRKLTVLGPQAERMRIGGSFNLGNPEGFARLLHQAYGLQLRETGTETTIFME